MSNANVSIERNRLGNALNPSFFSTGYPGCRTNDVLKLVTPHVLIDERALSARLQMAKGTRQKVNSGVIAILPWNLQAEWHQFRQWGD